MKHRVAASASLFLLLCLLCLLCVLCRAEHPKDCGDEPARYDLEAEFDECQKNGFRNKVCGLVRRHNENAYRLLWMDWENCRMGA